MLRYSFRCLCSSKIDLPSALKILGFSSAQISQKITPEAVREKYLDLSKSHHPDVNNGDGTKMKQIDLAYEALQRFGYSSVTASNNSGSRSSKENQEQPQLSGRGKSAADFVADVMNAVMFEEIETKFRDAIQQQRDKTGNGNLPPDLFEQLTKGAIGKGHSSLGSAIHAEYLKVIAFSDDEIRLCSFRILLQELCDDVSFKIAKPLAKDLLPIVKTVVGNRYSLHSLAYDNFQAFLRATHRCRDDPALTTFREFGVVPLNPDTVDYRFAECGHIVDSPNLLRHVLYFSSNPSYVETKIRRLLEEVRPYTPVQIIAGEPGTGKALVSLLVSSSRRSDFHKSVVIYLKCDEVIFPSSASTSSSSSNFDVDNIDLREERNCCEVVMRALNEVDLIKKYPAFADDDTSRVFILIDGIDPYRNFLKGLCASMTKGLTREIACRLNVKTKNVFLIVCGSGVEDFHEPPSGSQCPSYSLFTMRSLKRDDASAKREK